MKLISKLAGGGYHPATGLSLPAEGETFDADDERGAQLVNAGLAAEPTKPPRAAKKEE